MLPIFLNHAIEPGRFRCFQTCCRSSEFLHTLYSCSLMSEIARCPGDSEHWELQYPVLFSYTYIQNSLLVRRCIFQLLSKAFFPSTFQLLESRVLRDPSRPQPVGG